MTKTYYPCHKEETILSPTDTRFNIDCYITDARYINSANRFGEFVLEFQPYGTNDHQMLMERAENAFAAVTMGMSYYSSKTPKLCLENKYGVPYTSQLFTMKVNEDFDYASSLDGRQASLTLHFRDAVDGSIYLQCEYLDLYEPVVAPEVEDEPVDEDDF